MLAPLLFIFLIGGEIVLATTAIIGTLFIIVGILSMHFGVPFVRTPAKYYEKIAQALALEGGDILYELGSGDGSFCLWAGSTYPHITAVGIERNPFLYLLARLRWHFAGAPSNIQFRKENFFSVSFKESNKIYAYLLESVLLTLTPRLEREFHGRLVSRAFAIKERPQRTLPLSSTPGSHNQHLLYLYEF